MMLSNIIMTFGIWLVGILTGMYIMGRYIMYIYMKPNPYKKNTRVAEDNESSK